MEENRRIFGYMPDGTPVEEITLRKDSACGGEITAKIITYGGAVRSLLVPDLEGNLVDVVLGFDTLEDYMAQDKYMGAIVGRYANRIGGAKFTLNGVEYKLAANDGENSLHGGNAGFDKQVWTVKSLGRDHVSLTLVSPDGQEGYPGTLEVEVEYSIDGQGQFCIDYSARSDKDTVCSLTNHSYFNLSRHDSGRVEDQFIIIHADRYTPIGPGSIPTGELAPVEGTPMDLRGVFGLPLPAGPRGTPVGAHIDDGFRQLALAGGYDHNWVINEAPRGNHFCRPAADAWSLRTGIVLHVYTSLPGVQFYTGNYLDGTGPRGKGGAVYGRRHGFCLETQYFPDTPNRPGFPSCVLKAGRGCRSQTKFAFSAREKG